jgi:hypothetical protein
VQPDLALHGHGVLGEKDRQEEPGSGEPRVARGTYDHAYRGNGNWPFNTIYAASYGLEASVNRFSSLGQAELWTSKKSP